MQILHNSNVTKEGNSQLKLDSFVIKRDENGVKYRTVMFNERKTTKIRKRGTEKLIYV